MKRGGRNKGRNPPIRERFWYRIMRMRDGGAAPKDVAGYAKHGVVNFGLSPDEMRLEAAERTELDRILQGRGRHRNAPNRKAGALTVRRAVDDTETPRTGRPGR
jgi:hypothetical protein